MKKTGKRQEWQEKKYSYVMYSIMWKYPAHVEMKRLLKEFNLNFRVRISCYWFPNLCQLLNREIVRKIMIKWKSRYFVDRGCRHRVKIYLHDGHCRITCIACQAKCKKIGNVYVSQTKNYLKNKMDGNYNYVRKRINLNLKIDTFANNFCEICRKHYDDFKQKN